MNIHNSSINVMQNWRACHGGSNSGSRTPTDDKLRDAALSFLESVKRSPERGQIVEVFWKESEGSNTMSWFRGKVTRVKSNGTCVKYDDDDVCVHNFHNDRNRFR